MDGRPVRRASRLKAFRSSSKSGVPSHPRAVLVKICRLFARKLCALSKARLTPPAIETCAPINKSVDRPVAPRLIPEVLEGVVERILPRLDHQKPEIDRRTSKRLVVALAVDRMDHAGQIMVSKQDQVRAHPADFARVLSERKDVEELVLHAGGLLDRVQFPKFGAGHVIDQLLEQP